MKLTGKRHKKLTFLTAAAYFFMFAVCAKGVALYASQHPPKDQLLSVHGIVREMHLGGDGKSTSLKIESDAGTYRYSSYYGKVWPGMKLLQAGDQVDLLAEKKRLNRNELIEGKSYYLWELVYRRQIIIPYETVREMVQSKEANLDHFINIWLAASFAILLFAVVRKMFLVKIH